MNQTNTVSAPRTKTYEITMTALMAAVTCILAPLSIPIGRERVCQDDFCKFSKFKYLSAEKSPNISCLHIS